MPERAGLTPSPSPSFLSWRRMHSSGRVEFGRRRDVLRRRPRPLTPARYPNASHCSHLITNPALLPHLLTPFPAPLLLQRHPFQSQSFTLRNRRSFDCGVLILGGVGGGFAQGESPYSAKINAGPTLVYSSEQGGRGTPSPHPTPSHTQSIVQSNSYLSYHY